MTVAGTKANFQSYIAVLGAVQVLYAATAGHIVNAALGTTQGWVVWEFPPATYTVDDFNSDTSGYTVQVATSISA